LSTEDTIIDLGVKFEPLFDLLECWDVIHDPNFCDLDGPEREYWLELSKVDTVVMYGGRDSGKTFGESIFIPIAAADYGHRILYTRYVMNTTDDSIAQAINERLELLGREDDFKFAKNTYQVTDGKGRIMIRGIKTSSGNQTAKLKSLEDISMFVLDEAEEMPTYEDWDKVRKSVRAKDKQCLSVVTFNPPTKEHWLYTELFEDKGVQPGFNGIKGNVLYIFLTYLDIGKENIAEHNWREYEQWREAYEKWEAMSELERETCDNKLKKWHDRYKFIVLGGFQDRAEGVIYEDWEIGEFDESLPKIDGLDFGSNDPDALTEVAIDFKSRRIYVREKYFKNNTSFDGLCKILADRSGYNRMIVADCAERRMINDLEDIGFNIERCHKGTDSVRNGIKKIQGFTIVASPESINLHRALNNYVWHDKKSKVPDHFMSDIPDSFRYAAMYLLDGDNTINW
jgi:phage terminase large subunit